MADHDQVHEAPQPPRLVPILVRLRPDVQARLRRLCRCTRIRQAEYLREAVTDLLRKYSNELERDEERPA